MRGPLESSLVVLSSLARMLFIYKGYRGRVLVVNAVEIVEQGPHDELMAQQGFYYKLFMSQFKGKGPAGEVDTSGFIST